VQSTIYGRNIIYISADEQCETELIKQTRAGIYKALLPETSEDLCTMMNTLTVRKINLPRLFINSFFHLRNNLLKEHTKGSTN
jgi:hypothetical protein